MTWDSAVIMALCALILLVMITLVAAMYWARFWRIKAWLDAHERPPMLVTTPLSTADQKAWLATPRRGAVMAPAAAKDNSVIIMSEDRDARILAEGENG